MRKHIKVYSVITSAILIVMGGTFGCEDHPAAEPRVGMCYYMQPGEYAYVFCTQPTTNSVFCPYELIKEHAGDIKYVRSGKLATYKDQATCKDDMDTVLDEYSQTGDLEPGPLSDEMGSGGLTTGGGTTNGGSAGCSTTKEQLDAKCMKKPVDVYDNCTLECNPVCVYVDGCNCGIQAYCDSVEPKCLALKAIGCTCSWCP